jgi:hypothetical protein
MDTTILESASLPAGFTGEELIPDVVRSWPSTRRVFDRYGLHCCGGPYGPVETIRYFSRAHDVPLSKLLAELREAAAATELLPAEEPLAPDPAGAIYRRFFTAGILVLLTAGATWGAILLFRLGLAGAFPALSPRDVNAHGHAQVFGWVGLFVMGFAYQAFPRFKQGALRRPRLALATFPLYLTGLVLRTAAEAVDPSPAALGVGLAGSGLEILAIAAFAGIVVETLLSPRTRRGATDHYILAATAWFVLQALYDAFLFGLTTTAADPTELASRITRFQPPLRDLQIHGFALLMVLGVSQRYLPGMIGLPRLNEKVANVLLIVLNLAIAGEVAGFLGAKFLGAQAWSPVRALSHAVLAAGAAVLTWKMGVLHAPAEPDRSVKFLRAAYGWLLLSLAMLALYPAYLTLLDRGDSHAYLGASRHAITVGFISLMILGVSAKVVPTLNGVAASTLPGLWWPFLLVNTGCALRVGFQTLTDFFPGAFPIAGVSGTFEVAGFALWGGHLLAVMAGRYSPTAAPATGAAPARASPGHNVGWLTAVAPETIPVFARLGFSPINNRLLRETVARTITIHQACLLKGIPEEQLLAGLDEVLAAGIRRRQPPPTPIEFVGRIEGRAAEP